MAEENAQEGNFFEQVENASIENAGGPVTPPSTIPANVTRDMFMPNESEMETLSEEGDGIKGEDGSDALTDESEESGSETSTGKGEEGAEEIKSVEEQLGKAQEIADARFKELLTKHGFEDDADLAAALDSGKTLKELLGKKDAAKLLKDSEELAEIKRQWKEQEDAKVEEAETEEQTIARLKRENSDLRLTYNNREADLRALKESERAILEYDRNVIKSVDSTEDLSESEKYMLSNILGVDNAANTVDITDEKAVAKLVADTTGKFRNFMKAVRQDTIDKYVAGQTKEKAGPSKSDKAGTGTPAVKARKVPKNASLEQTFDIAKAELKEIFAAMKKGAG